MAGVDERQNCLCWWSWRERPDHRNPGRTLFVLVASPAGTVADIIHNYDFSAN
jgi:hypothetical protein